MRTMTAQREAQKQQQARQVETKIKQPQNDKAVSTKSIDMNSLNVQTLPEIINPALMKRKMKLPNGAEISARQYIQEIVCPQLPKMESLF